MEGVFELRLHLTLGARQSESDVQSSAGAGGCSTTNSGSAPVGPTLRMQEPARRFSGDERKGSHLTSPSPAHSQSFGSSRRSGDGGAMPVQAEGETYVKQIRDMPVFDGTKAAFPPCQRNFQYLEKLHDLFEIFIAGVQACIFLSLTWGYLFLCCNKTSPEKTPRITAALPWRGTSTATL